MLLSKLKEDMKKAMKARDTIAVDTLRLLLSDINYAAVDQKEELKDEDIVAIISRAIKRRGEAIEQFRKGGRDDLAGKEEKEKEILEAYMPEKLSPEELHEAVDAAIRQVEASSMKQLGLVMKAVLAEYKGRVDGKELSRGCDCDSQRSSLYILPEAARGLPHIRIGSYRYLDLFCGFGQLVNELG